VGLLAFYVSFVLGSILRAAGFTAMMCALYGALFILLRSRTWRFCWARSCAG